MAAKILKQSLDFLKSKVDNYNGSTSSVVEISNIATLNDGDEFLKSTSPIILSVINIEEERLAKNPDIYLKKTNPNAVDRLKNPAQHFVTSLLFTAYNKEQTNEKYLDGIIKLEHVIRCFQEQHVFFINGNTEVDPAAQPHIKLILDMESLKFNELNQLWSILGNKYMPSVLYKMRMISIQNDKKEGEAIIEQFKIKLWENRPKDPTGLLEESKYLKK